jgi:hypothetical protein
MKQEGNHMNTRLLRFLVHGILGILFFLSSGLFAYANLRAGSTLAQVAISALLLGVPLGAMFFSLGLLVEAWVRHRQGSIGKRMARFLYLTPRISGILIAVFTGLFALDVFEIPGTFWEKLLGFVIHAAPAIVMIVLLVLAWRWEWVGTLAFGAAALYMLRFVIGGWKFDFGNLLLFVLPMSLIASLFWLNWRWRQEIRKSSIGA